MKGLNLAEKVNVIEGYTRPTRVVLAAVANPLDEIISRKTVRQHVYEFAAIMGIALCVLASILAWHRPNVLVSGSLTILAIVFVLQGKRNPALIRPIWKGWMTFGTALGIVVSTVILGAVWFAMLIPTALGMRLAGKLVMDTSFRTDAVSYYKDRAPGSDDFKLLERQY